MIKIPDSSPGVKPGEAEIPRAQIAQNGAPATERPSGLNGRVHGENGHAEPADPLFAPQQAEATAIVRLILGRKVLPSTLKALPLDWSTLANFVQDRPGLDPESRWTNARNQYIGSLSARHASTAKLLLDSLTAAWARAKEQDPGDEPEEGEGGNDEEVIDRWPRIDPAAFYGVAGDIVTAIDPHTEADPIAMLAQILLAFANMVGRGPHFAVGATRHYLNIFVALVGATAVGRKGSSWDAARWALEAFDPAWVEQRIQGGLVSGEGLIHHVRDAVMKREPVKEKGRVIGYQDVETDAGVSDKRLLVLETEMGRLLKAMNRESNTTSDVVRQAWDNGNLRTMAKNCGSMATGAHVSIVGHVTRADVTKHLMQEDSCNGFANRFLWVAVRRSKQLPDGGDLNDPDFLDRWEPIRIQLEQAVAFARECGRMQRDSEASKLWHEVYGDLTDGKPGMLGAVLGRAEAQVMRLACVYALLDQSHLVRARHLTAALALWKYCEESARFVFGESLGDPAADKLLAALKAAPDGLSRTQISVDVFGRNKKGADLAKLLSDLLTQGLIHNRGPSKPKAGRPAERWFAGKGAAHAG